MERHRRRVLCPDGLWSAVRVHTKTLRTVLLHGPEGLFPEGSKRSPPDPVYGLDGIYLVFLICLFRIHAGLLGFTVLEEVLGHGREQGIR